MLQLNLSLPSHLRVRSRARKRKNSSYKSIKLYLCLRIKKGNTWSNVDKVATDFNNCNLFCCCGL